MSYFNQASDFSIDNAAFVNFEGGATITNEILVNQESKPDLRHLLQFVARGASHDSKAQFESPKCAPETRTQLLSDIHEWVKVPDKVTGITFLHGPAGSGKSCIARSVCEKAASEELLGGSFFFWRSASSRNNESRLITTLAYQLAERNEELRKHILSAFAKDPRIVDMPLEVQFEKLLSQPCKRIPPERGLRFQVIVIDGLDECMGESTQIHILQILAKAVRYEGFPLGFFVTSRPELHLQEALETKQITFATNIISLNRVSGVSQDIQTVLESGFISILNNPRFKGAMKSVPRPWPTQEMIEKLVRRSSGQFIYSATVLKFVSSPNHNPAAQLEIVLGIRDSKGSSPFADLDLLYNQIMSGVSDPELTVNVLRYVLAIKDLGRRMTRMKNLDLRFSPDITKAVLHNQNRLLLIVEQLLELSEGTAYLALNQLHSLISLNVGSESTRRRLEIDFYHKSFQDFLRNKQRSETFHVNLSQAHFDIAKSCLKYLSRPHYHTAAHHVGWLYSSFQWNIHGYLTRQKLHLSTIDSSTSLQTFFEQSSNHLNISHLIDAMRTIGLLDQYLQSEVLQKAVTNMRMRGILSNEDLKYALNDILETTFGRDEHFNKTCTYPFWRRYLQAYKNDSLIKQLLLIHDFREAMSKPDIPDSEIYGLLKGMGFTPEESDRSPVLHILGGLRSLLPSGVCSGPSFLNGEIRCLKKFLKNTTHSGPFYCSPEDFARFYAGVLSFSGIWRDDLLHFFGYWKVDGYIISATDTVVENLNSAALEYYENVDLAKKLYNSIERYLMDCLRNLLQPPQEEVIKAWERTFDRARSIAPANFRYE